MSESEAELERVTVRFRGLTIDIARDSGSRGSLGSYDLVGETGARTETGPLEGSSAAPASEPSLGEGSEQAQVVFRKEAKQGTKVEEEIKRKLYLLHAATGHGSTKNLVEALKRRNVNPLVLCLAEEFQCPICQECKRAQPRQLASLEPLPPKFHTVTADIGHWNCTNSGETQNFMMIVDEGSRFRVAKILTKGNKNRPPMRPHVSTSWPKDG